MTKVKAYAATRARAPLSETTIELGELLPTDVEIEVAACSLCHSDLHLLDGDWGIGRFPLVVGHEVVGRIADVGAAVKDLARGDMVGVGWQCGSCGSCVACTQGYENLCTGGKRRTCVDQSGGLAERVRADHRFAFKLPAGLTPERAAPLFCAGVTVFAPLMRHGVKAGSRVGVVGLGGLGHLAVQFARAMGADVTAFDPDAGKSSEALKLGATRLVGVDPETLAREAKTAAGLDVLLTTTHANLHWDAWLSLVALNGTLCIAGVPSEPLRFASDHLIDGQKKVTGSAIGSPSDMRAMLAFAALHRVTPMTEERPFHEVNQAFESLRAGRPRYRLVLTGTI